MICSKWVIIKWWIFVLDVDKIGKSSLTSICQILHHYFTYFYTNQLSKFFEMCKAACKLFLTYYIIIFRKQSEIFGFWSGLQISISLEGSIFPWSTFLIAARLHSTTISLQAHEYTIFHPISLIMLYQDTSSDAFLFIPADI